MKTRLSLSLALWASLSLSLLSLSAQNPYLPLWEFIPDGEPYVFADPDCPGKERVYIYGSHDIAQTEYCGRNQVVWSAPVEDLTQWRYEGVAFQSILDANGKMLNESGIGDMLYAPDITYKDGLYYFYPNNQTWGHRNAQVAVGTRPGGPFHVINWNDTIPYNCDGELGFDPAVFVDDDGRVYAYWGYIHSEMAELDPDKMYCVKAGTPVYRDRISSIEDSTGIYRFLEASSMRKIEDKYVLIFSRFTADGESGLPVSNYTLAYCYSDQPLGPWTYGGTVIDARAPGIDDEGKAIPTANPFGNTHGGLCLINGQWWIFYHRQTGLNEFSRQAMVAPVQVSVEKGKGGKVTISQAEVTSEGFRTEGLDPLAITPAALACYFTHPKKAEQQFPNFTLYGSYVEPKQNGIPVVNNTSGSTIGYKYFNFDKFAKAKKVNLHLNLVPKTEGQITVLVGGPTPKQGGKEVGRITITQNSKLSTLHSQHYTLHSKLSTLKGKQPLFFVFSSETEGQSICDFYDFQFEIIK